MSLTLYTASWREMANRHAEGDLSIVPVRISLGRPKFWPAGASAPYVAELAPAGLLRKPPLPWGEFERFYAQRLNAIGVDRIAARLEEVYSEYGRPLALCCFEPWRCDCHREIAAAWLEQHGIGPVPELSPGVPGLTEPAHNAQHGDIGQVRQLSLESER